MLLPVSVAQCYHKIVRSRCETTTLHTLEKERCKDFKKRSRDAWNFRLKRSNRNIFMANRHLRKRITTTRVDAETQKDMGERLYHEHITQKEN